MKITLNQLAQAEKHDFTRQVNRWADIYGPRVFGQGGGKGHPRLFVRMMATRFRKNGICDAADIETLIDIFLTDEMSQAGIIRFSTLILDPSLKPDEKMSEIRKQFRGEKMSKAPGFKLWKLR